MIGLESNRDVETQRSVALSDSDIVRQHASAVGLLEWACCFRAGRDRRDMLETRNLESAISNTLDRQQWRYGMIGLEGIS